MINLIERLSALPGVSGDEDAVRSAIIHEIDGIAPWRVDALGNLIVEKKGKKTPKNKLLFSAHMDEVGLIITAAESSGMLRFATVGGIHTAALIGKPVRIGTDGITGVIGTKAVHLQSGEERDKLPKLEDLYLDIGADSKEEALEKVRLGDRAVFDSSFLCFGEDCIMGKALDDRAGCTLLIEMIRSELEYDCAFSFTVQEETGTAGAKTAAYQLQPEIAIAVETTTASDIPDVGEHKTVCQVGGGPVVSFMDKGTIYDQELYRLAMETAREHGILAQPKAGVYGGNEARSLQTAAAGARVLAISLPCRYLHSPACMLKQSDINGTRELLMALLPRLAQL